MNLDTFITNLRAEHDRLAGEIRDLDDEAAALRERAALREAELRSLTAAESVEERARKVGAEVSRLRTRVSVLEAQARAHAQRVGELDAWLTAGDRLAACADRSVEVRGRLAEVEARHDRIKALARELDDEAAAEQGADACAAEAEIAARLAGKDVHAPLAKRRCGVDAKLAALDVQWQVGAHELAMLRDDLRLNEMLAADARADAAELRVAALLREFVSALAAREVARDQALRGRARARVPIELGESALQEARQRIADETAS